VVANPHIASGMGVFAKFISRITILENGCWEWSRGRSTSGYGTVLFNGKPAYTHRVSLWFAGIDIPKGMHVDHLCRHRLCVNPWHLEVVTPGENARRAPECMSSINRARTHCKNGHPLTGDNVRIRKGKGSRVCWACHLERDRRRLADPTTYAAHLAAARARYAAKKEVRR